MSDFFREGGPGYTVTARKDEDDCQIIIKVHGVVRMTMTLRPEQMKWLGHDCLRAAKDAGA
jgi:hypothetical protein